MSFEQLYIISIFPEFSVFKVNAKTIEEALCSDCCLMRRNADTNDHLNSIAC